MQGTVTVVGAKPSFGRAGKFKVKVDGGSVAKVRQGHSLELLLEPGEHRFRVTGGGCRSKQVEIAVAPGSHHFLYAGVNPLLVPAVGLVLGAITYAYGLIFALPLVVVLMAVPGSWFTLSAAEAPEAAQVAAAPVETGPAVGADTGEMWWHNDPNLAKRYRK